MGGTETGFGPRLGCESGLGMKAFNPLGLSETAGPLVICTRVQRSLEYVPRNKADARMQRDSAESWPGGSSYMRVHQSSNEQLEAS